MLTPKRGDMVASSEVSRAKRSDGERDKDAVRTATTGRAVSSPGIYALRENCAYNGNAKTEP